MYRFLTNFTDDMEPLYREASEVYGLDSLIKDEAYSDTYQLLEGYKSFHVDSSARDLSDFWAVFDRLEDEKKLTNATKVSKSKGVLL